MSLKICRPRAAQNGPAAGVSWDESAQSPRRAIPQPTQLQPTAPPPPPPPCCDAAADAEPWGSGRTRPIAAAATTMLPTVPPPLAPPPLPPLAPPPPSERAGRHELPSRVLVTPPRPPPPLATRLQDAQVLLPAASAVSSRSEAWDVDELAFLPPLPIPPEWRLVHELRRARQLLSETLLPGRAARRVYHPFEGARARGVAPA